MDISYDSDEEENYNVGQQQAETMHPFMMMSKIVGDLPERPSTRNRASSDESDENSQRGFFSKYLRRKSSKR